MSSQVPNTLGADRGWQAKPGHYLFLAGHKQFLDFLMDEKKSKFDYFMTHENYVEFKISALINKVLTFQH